MIKRCVLPKRSTLREELPSRVLMIRLLPRAPMATRETFSSIATLLMALATSPSKTDTAFTLTVTPGDLMAFFSSSSFFSISFISDTGSQTRASGSLEMTLRSSTSFNPGISPMHSITFLACLEKSVAINTFSNISSSP